MARYSGPLLSDLKIETVDGDPHEKGLRVWWRYVRKNILRKMLDGHSGIVCSHVHDRVAFSLLSRPGAAYIKREWSENRKSFDNGTSSLKVLFESGDRSTSIYRKMGLVLPANNIHELIRETNEIVNNPEYRRLTIYKQRGAFENGLRLMGAHWMIY